MLFFNEKIYIAEYLSDGLSVSSIKNRMNSPNYAMRIYSEMASLDIRKHSNKCTFYTLRFGCSFAVSNTIKLNIMNRQEFEELELQLQQSGLPLKSYLHK